MSGKWEEVKESKLIYNKGHDDLHCPQCKLELGYC